MANVVIFAFRQHQHREDAVGRPPVGIGAERWQPDKDVLVPSGRHDFGRPAEKPLGAGRLRGRLGNDQDGSFRRVGRHRLSMRRLEFRIGGEGVFAHLFETPELGRHRTMALGAGLWSGRGCGILDRVVSRGGQDRAGEENQEDPHPPMRVKGAALQRHVNQS